MQEGYTIQKLGVSKFFVFKEIHIFIQKGRIQSGFLFQTNFCFDISIHQICFYKK